MRYRNTFCILLLTFILHPVAIFAQPDINAGQSVYRMAKTNVSTSYEHEWGNTDNGFTAMFSHRILRDKYSTFTVNARYTSMEADFATNELSHGFHPDEIGINGNHAMGKVGITYTCHTMAGNKPVMAMAMLNSECGANKFQRISGIAMGMYMLRATKDTRFGVGVLALVNSCSKVPVFPVFIYYHRLSGKCSVNVYGPMISFDYTPSRGNIVSIGADVDVKTFYFRPENDRLPEYCRFTATSFRPMAKYRHRLTPNLYIYAQTGIVLNMSCRVNGVTGTKEYFRCHRDATTFVQVGMAYSL